MGEVIPFRRKARRRPTALIALAGVLAASALGYAGTRPGVADAASAGDAGLYVSHLRKCAEGERNTPIKTCVVDGDTLWLHGTDYRLKDFDTPEPYTNICGGAAEVALAGKAGDRFLQLLNSNRWTIETYGTDATGHRTLATIRIGNRDVGDFLISERLARRWPDGDEWWCRLK